MHKMAHITLYTDPKPPAPIILVLEKLLVAVAMVGKSNKGNSKFSLLSWSVKMDNNLEATFKAQPHGSFNKIIKVDKYAYLFSLFSSSEIETRLLSPR